MKRKNDFLYNTKYLVFFIFLTSTIYLAWFNVGHIPFPNYCLVFIVLCSIFFVLYVGKIKISKKYIKAFPVILLAVALISIVIIELQFALSYSVSILIIIKKIIVPFFLYLLAYYMVIFFGYELLIKIIVVIIGVSGFIAIGQAFEIEMFWKIRTITGAGGDSDVIAQFYNKPMGLSYFAISLCYQLIIAIPLTWYLYVKKKNKIWLVFFLIMVFAIIIIKSKAGYIACGGMLFFYLVFKKKSVFSVIVITCSMFFLILYEPMILKIHLDSDDYGRIAVAAVALKNISHNPFGIGFQSYNTFVEKWIDLNIVKDLDSAFFVRYYAPHNQILNTFLFYGWITGILLIIFYIRYYILLRKNHNYLLQCILLSHIGYLFYSLFHNNGVLMGHRIYWIMIGISEYCLINVEYQRFAFMKENK